MTEVQPQVGVPTKKKRTPRPPSTLPFEARITCSIKDAIDGTSLSRSWLYQKMQRGELDYRQHGRRRLVVVASLRKLIGLAD
jgi:hypothetical protein